jgi:uncharacterized membrane protein YidH (DUF202 family)
MKAKERSTEQGEARVRAIGIAVIVVSFLAVVVMVLNYQRNMNQIDQISRNNSGHTVTSGRSTA